MDTETSHIEWGQSEREKTNLYNIVSVWNPEKMVQMNLCTKEKQRHSCWITKGKGGGMNWETRIDVCVWVGVWVCARECSVESNSLQLHGMEPTRLLCPWNFLRQEYWSGLPFPPSGDLLEPDIKSMSSALAGRFFITEPLMRIYCGAQGTLFNALSWTKWGGNTKKRENAHTYSKMIHFVI